MLDLEDFEKMFSAYQRHQVRVPLPLFFVPLITADSSFLVLLGTDWCTSQHEPEMGIVISLYGIFKVEMGAQIRQLGH